MSSFSLISSAYAQTAAGAPPAGAADLFQSFLPILLVVGIFYFLLIRPQQKKAKELRNQLSELRRGDNVLTAGGIIGSVVKAPDGDEITLEIAEGVRVRVVRATITAVLGKGEPRTDAAKSDKDDKRKSSSDDKAAN